MSDIVGSGSPTQEQQQAAFEDGGTRKGADEMRGNGTVGGSLNAGWKDWLVDSTLERVDRWERGQVEMGREDAAEKIIR